MFNNKKLVSFFIFIMLGNVSVANAHTIAELQLIQILKDDINGADGIEQFVNPQKIVVSPNGRFLSIACAKSNSLVVFHKQDTGKYRFLQAKCLE